MFNFRGILSSCLLLVAAVCLFIAGCGQDADAPLDVDTCRPGRVLAEVDGHAVTVRNFRARRALELALFTQRRKKLPEEKMAAARAAFAARRNRSLLAELVNQRLVRDYLEEKLATATRADAARATAQIEAAVTGAVRKIRFKTLEEAAATLGVERDYLKDQLAVPSRIVVARELFAGKPFTVTEAEVDEGLARMQRYHDRAAASNAVTQTTASNVLARVQAGEDFAALGRQTAGFAPEEARKWGDFEAGDLENRALREWAFAAPVGSVGGPFDIEDGLCVVKILARTDGSPEPSLAAEETASVTLARIAFHMLVEDPEPRTRAHVRTSLEEWKAEEAQKALFAALHAKMRLAYPNGTNFVFSTSETPSRSLKEDGK